ncbi:MAG: winged helix-turn-helix domain-containing protein [Gammaproteobacteria bacterium]
MDAPKITFDGWVLDRQSGDLSRDGVRQRLQEMPLKVLDLLIASPGTVVTREQFIAHLWPGGVVDFDTGLNTAVRKLRVALGDVADTPRYIETLPRRGYRFIGTLSPPVQPSAVEPGSGEPAEPPEARVPVGELSPRPPVLPATSPEPAARPSADELPAPAPIPTAVATHGRRRALLIAILAGIVLASALAYWSLNRTRVGAAQVPATSEPSSGPALPAHVVAVLPFENLSAEPNNDFLALGIAETVLYKLAELHDLTVIARTSSFVFRNRNEDARDIGRRLNARYLVEGSVQREGERLRVTTELIDASSGRHVWSLRFDRQLVDIFALQDEISGKVADALSVSLTAGAERGPEGRTSKVDAYLAFLQGRALANTFKIADTESAVGRFANAIEIDPQYAAAYAQEARAISQVSSLREMPDPVADAKAAALIDKALELDPTLGEAWVQRASSRDVNNKEESAIAEQEFRKGLALAPNYGEGFAQFAEFLYGLERFDEALTVIERARQVDPLSARNHYLKGLFEWYSGSGAAAAEPLFLQALKINPNYHAALNRLGRVMSAKGEFAEGVKLMERALTLEPEADWAREPLMTSYLSMGDVLAAADVLKSAGESSRGLDICILAYQGKARAAVEKAYALFRDGHWDSPSLPERCAVAAIRNDALATRKYDRALGVLEAQYGVHSAGPDGDVWIAGVWGLPYVQILRAKGEEARARQLNESILIKLESSMKKEHPQPNAPYWYAVARAQVGDADEAVASLQAALRNGLHSPRWLIEPEGAFAGIRNDVRYQAIIESLNANAKKQAALAAGMRRRREIPQRPSSTDDHTNPE